MLPKIVARLKTGTIKNVVPFGSKLLSAPYVVVKPEIGIGGRIFRIICHRIPGEQMQIEDYIFDELSDLLTNFKSKDRYENTFKILATEDWSDITTENDDGTISMERLFFVPQRLH